MPAQKSKARTAAAAAHLGPTSPARRGLVVLGNQLFAPAQLQDSLGENTPVGLYMREDAELCTYYRFHRHKIVFFLAAMRHAAKEYTQAGFAVTYEQLPAKKTKQAPYETHLLAWVEKNRIDTLVSFEVEDHFFAARLQKLCARAGLGYEVLPSPMFLTSRPEFADYLAKHRRPFMKTFYEGQRQRLGILVEADGRPFGGRWSYDVQNRQPLPPNEMPPAVTKPAADAVVAQVQKLCDVHFAHHPGVAKDFWLPVTRKAAKLWLQKFLRERLRNFGPYEDALTTRSDVVYHAVLTPFLNVGLLTPAEVIRATLAQARADKTPLASTEGFVRQVIGWREFIRGIYHNFAAKQEQSNFFGHQRRLRRAWYGANTGIVPLDDVLAKVMRLGYAHHIERLMVLGSLMLTLEVHPKEAHRWFMEMFVDSSDWVMGPNVYGMALFADGGIFATKPYLCGSNYFRKMGGYKKGDWCDAVDGLYWRFMHKHRAFFGKNPRLAAIARGADRLAPARKERIFAAAQALQDRLTEKPTP